MLLSFHPWIKYSLFFIVHHDIDILLMQEMRKVVDMINYEIEYVLRPVSAPIR